MIQDWLLGSLAIIILIGGLVMLLNGVLKMGSKL
ncbi:hypothetical protein PCC7424_5708 (plasmid) [Gloeothece citriformis PCC 7424]|uniref:Uncharacterized protein n=1 Tax=Gloeothece citriformis (strain PCC 7424) TaxID=65393 RepID=B7KLV1_GLOC7|nr:hypothetical protein PCC7424_5708 [Gloeothece citriformis PCC 7424]